MAASNLQLHASAHLIGQECKESNYSFLLCKKQSMDPAACLTEGASVKKCVDNLIASLNKTCEKEFSSYIKCLDKNQFMFEKCKKEKEALHQSFAAVKAPE